MEKINQLINSEDESNQELAKQLLIVNDFNSNDFLCTNYPSGAKLNWRGQGNTKLRTDNNFQENDETKAD